MHRLGQGRAVDLEAQPRPLHGRAEHAGQLRGDRRELDGLEVRLHAARFEPGEVQQGVDQLAEPQTVAVDDFQLLTRLRVRLAQPVPQVLHRAHDERERGAELVADVGEERGLGAVELGELLGTALLGLEVVRSRDARGDVARDQVDEPAVAVVERTVPVQAGDQEPVRCAARPLQRHHQRLGGRSGPVAAGKTVEPFPVEVDHDGLAAHHRLHRPHR